MSTWNTFGRGILPHLRFGRFPRPLFAAAREDVFPPLSEDPLASFDFLAEFLPPAIDFEEGFRFDESFNFGDSGDGISMNAAGGSLSYGAYDDESCSFSVESSVRLRRRRHRRKQRCPNRLYRKESIKLSS